MRHEIIFEDRRVKVFACQDEEMDWGVYFLVDGDTNHHYSSAQLPVKELVLAKKAWVSWVKHHRYHFIYCLPWMDDSHTEERVALFKKLGFRKHGPEMMALNHDHPLYQM